MIFLLIALTVLIGALMPVQAGINAQLTRLVQHPYLGALISFTIGTLVLSLVTLIQGFPSESLKRLTEAPPHFFLGGLLGALFVASSIFLIPKMGPTIMIAALITGQLIMSVIIDHYGLLGLPVIPVNPIRLLGVALLFVGVFLVIRKNA